MGTLGVLRACPDRMEIWGVEAYELFKTRELAPRNATPGSQSAGDKDYEAMLRSLPLTARELEVIRIVL